MRTDLIKETAAYYYKLAADESNEELRDHYLEQALKCEEKSEVEDRPPAP